MAYKTEKVRRVVGIMWDLGTFWPRDAHPLAPPCYAERAVPEIAKRVTWLARTKPAAGVVPTGHSQGSVLLAATVRQLPADVRTRLALLTYGSPLTRLYGKYFPTYFGPTELELVAGDLALPEAGPRWINLYYDTDPIGGTVLPAPVDHGPLLPTQAFHHLPGDTVYPFIRGHSDYPTTPEFGDAVHHLAASLTSPLEPSSAQPSSGPPGSDPPPSSANMIDVTNKEESRRN